MKVPLYLPLPFIFLICLSTLSRATIEDFLECLTIYSQNSTSISSVIYTPTNSSYTSVLQLNINNPRFATADIPKPNVIVTPLDDSHIQTVIFCSKKHDIQMKIRSGGHDFEGLSYRTTYDIPFVMLDMINFRSVNVDLTTKTAWVQSGATLGELYYAISQETSTLGFPGGLWYTVGVGGLISGGGYGNLRRKYGLAADNVIDARLIDVKGRILDRQSMGEGLFWAIRGGGSSSFGVTLSWKIKLVQVPEIVTLFNIDKTLEQNATTILHKWQSVAPNVDKNLEIRVLANCILSNSSTREDKRTILVSFQSVFLGRIDRLLPLMQQNFPELGLTRNDCSEVSWIQAVLFSSGFSIQSSPNTLLNRTSLPKNPLKVKSSFVKQAISIEGLEGIWQKLYLLAPQTTLVVLTPYGGRMSEISESEIPFPHRGGNLYMLEMVVLWAGDTELALSWIRGLYDYLGPYVAKNPRTSYVNYNDLDLGVNNPQGRTSYEQASIWGKKYFKDNFDRLLRVKFRVDPSNFFRHEQSVPPILVL